jgi:type IV secretion system protein VirB10
MATTSAPTPAEMDSETALDPPHPDINAVGGAERPFPWLLLLGIGLVILLCLVALILWLRIHPPFQTTRKEDPPAQPSPSATAPRLTLAADATASAPSPDVRADARTTVPGPLPAAAPASSAPCAPSLVLDKQTGRPLAGPQGQALGIDCRGQIIPRNLPGTQSAALQPTSPAPQDRYGGPVLLVKQEAVSPAEAGTGVAPYLPATLPTPPRPAPIPGLASPVTPLLEQLRALQGTSAVATGVTAATPATSASAAALQAPNAQGPLAPTLKGTRSDAALAVRNLDENLTVPKGAQIDCVLTTRVVTEISGFASCLISQNVYSANGRTLLIERMSEVQGEYATTSGQTGQRNIHILWTRLRKPGGITVDLASPATDGLGGAGIPGHVDNRWFDRIGSAYLLSFIKDAIAYQTARDAAPGNAVGAAAYGNTVQQSNQLAERVLDASINVRPTQYANQGARVAIYVARDLDFSQVYAVRPR